MLAFRRFWASCLENGSDFRVSVCEHQTQTWRLFACGICNTPTEVCPGCDHGQRYCSELCARLARRMQQRLVSRGYQDTQPWPSKGKKVAEA